MRELIIRIIDRFYIPPFRKYIPLDTFRYAACGGLNMAFGWVLYFITYHFILHEQNLDLGIVVMSPHVASLILVNPVIFTTGFLLNNYVVFKGAPLKDTTKLFRYLMAWGFNLVFTYLGLKPLVEVLHIYPTLSNIIVSLVTVAISYLLQRNFTFRGFKR